MHIDPVARKVCEAEGNDQLMDTEDVAKILQVPHNYGAPEEVDSIYQGLDRPLQF